MSVELWPLHLDFYVLFFFAWMKTLSQRLEKVEEAGVAFALPPLFEPENQKIEPDYYFMDKLV